MIRGLQYLAWYRDMANYHPCLPMKRMQMVEDIVDMEGTALIWSCMGSAGIGLPFLDKEINEPPLPRLRVYGFLSDKEFCAECANRGITVYGVVWKAQLWEFPAEFNDNETELLSMNITRGVGKRGWVGIRELSQDRYPAIFASMKDFLPQGLQARDGEPIVDYLAVLKSESLEGRDILSRWLMAPDHEHVCYLPCANKPAYTQYIKKAIEMMIDGGAGGVFIDEPDSQLIATRDAGCFCAECREQFRAYLHAHPAQETAGLDLDSFDYRDYLVARGVTDADLLKAGANSLALPLARSWIAFQWEGSVRNVAEYSQHARDYALATRGKPVPVTANVFDASAYGLSYLPHIDVLSGEKPDLGLRNDDWYRYAYAYASGKPTVFTNSPNEYIARINDDMRDGKPDGYLLQVLEAYAQGVCMAVGYGSWLGHRRKDAIWMPKPVADLLGRWLKDNEALFPAKPVADTALLFDHCAGLEEELFSGLSGGVLRVPGGRPARQTFAQMGALLCRHHRLYRVEIVSASDPLTPERLAPYKNLILPDCYGMPEGDCEVVQAWIAAGGRALIVGKGPQKAIDAETAMSPDDPAALAWTIAAPQRVTVTGPDTVAMALHETADGYVMHLVNYSMNAKTKGVDRVDEMSFTLDFDARLTATASFPYDGVEATQDGRTLSLRNIGLYTILRLTCD